MNTKKLSEYALIFMGGALVIFLLDMFSSFLRPLTIAIILSFLFTPLLRISKKKRRRAIYKFCLYGVVLIGIVVGLSFVIISGLTKTGEATEIQGFSGADFLSGYSLTVGESTISLSQIINVDRIKGSLGNLMGSVVNALTSFISELFLVVLFLVFLLPLENSWIRQMRRSLPKKKLARFMNTLVDMEDGVRSYLKMKTIISLGTSVVSLILLMLFGVEYAVLFAILIFGLNYIPNIGSILAVGLVLVVQFLAWGLVVKLGALALLLIAVQILFGNYLEPKLTGRSLDISPLNILIGLLFWGAVWGIGGMLFSVPLTLAIKNFLKHSEATEDIAELI